MTKKLNLKTVWHPSTDSTDTKNEVKTDSLKSDTVNDGLDDINIDEKSILIK